jgi:large subunit ribosomal protein L14e
VPVARISVGQLVRSNAGRDSGHVYLVIGAVGPATLLLADGRGRRAARPKRKNIRHISVLKFIDKGVAAKVDGRQATDEEIRQAIRAYVNTGE